VGRRAGSGPERWPNLGQAGATESDLGRDGRALELGCWAKLQATNSRRLDLGRTIAGQTEGVEEDPKGGAKTDPPRHQRDCAITSIGRAPDRWAWVGQSEL
jgi:hypothetical protein